MSVRSRMSIAVSLGGSVIAIWRGGVATHYSPDGRVVPDEYCEKVRKCHPLIDQANGLDNGITCHDGMTCNTLAARRPADLWVALHPKTGLVAKGSVWSTLIR